MIDINTHRIIDLLDSRDLEDVVKWLKTYPNLKIVSRDGSITYKNAISSSHPNAIQISDRFHILKNLTSYAITYLNKKVKQWTMIPSTNLETESYNIDKNISPSNYNRKLTLEKKYTRANELKRQGMNKSNICKTLNMDIRTYNRLLHKDGNTSNTIFNTTKNEATLERRALKAERVVEVRVLKQEGLSNHKISALTGLSHKTISKYLDENFSVIHASTGRKYQGILSPYMKEIDEYLEQGIMGTAIEEKIRRRGYKGSSSTIRHYISQWKKRINQVSIENAVSSRNPVKAEKIARKDIIKLLFYPLEKIHGFSKDKLKSLCCEIPLFEIIYNLVWWFRNILADKKVDELDKWIAFAKTLSIKEINSFINGIDRDIVAVRNAVKYEYSNGLAEGSVNKFKLIKRVMYGRCKFQTLRNKVLKLERMRYIN